LKLWVIIKIAVDVLVTVTILALMGRHLWGDLLHEWLGVCAGALIITHSVLNHKWYAALFKGRYTLHRVMVLCVNILLLTTMTALMFSGIVMSQSVFGLRIQGITALSRKLHILGSYWGFALVSLHLGMHWNMLVGIARRCFRRLRQSRVRQVTLFLFALAIAAYGAYVFVKRDFLTYMLIKSEFVFLDYDESKLLFYLDYLALMGLGVFVAHYGVKVLRTFSNNKKRGIENA
jgi:hypothetical protein